MEELMKMLAKKKDDKMSPDEVQAKMDVIKELLGMADEHMGSKVKSGLDDMQKVSVMAPDSESLEAGLDKAQDLVGAMPEDEDDEENADEKDASEVPESMESDDDEAAKAMDASPADEAMASVDDSYEDDMNPFNKKHKMMMEKRAKA